MFWWGFSRKAPANHECLCLGEAVKIRIRLPWTLSVFSPTQCLFTRSREVLRAGTLQVSPKGTCRWWVQLWGLPRRALLYKSGKSALISFCLISSCAMSWIMAWKINVSSVWQKKSPLSWSTMTKTKQKLELCSFSYRPSAFPPVFHTGISLMQHVYM